jgi:hypothetical protein
MDTPKGFQGCQKIRIVFFSNKTVFALRLPSKGTNFEKLSKLKKKMSKNPVFLEFFEYSSIWGQS